ncbi:MAG: hypothetical protein RLY43_1808, partial [Bacteroidota bacterium]
TLRSVIPDENFINLSDLICNSSITCKIFTDDYYLISYDGYHLSKFGAKYVADKIHNEKKLHFLF